MRRAVNLSKVGIKMMKTFLICALAALAVLSNGCDRDNVKVYHVAKEDSAAPPPDQIAAPEQMPTTQMQPSQQPQLQFTLPDGWQEIAPSQMRVASFTVTNANGQTADVGVIPLPATGREIQLVNMWREQMKLPALTNETAVETVSVGNDPAKLFDIASEQPLIDGKFRARILVAELTRGATSWFFKMTGEDSFVTAQKENFLQFLKSVLFVENIPAQISGTGLGSQNFLVPKTNTLVIGGAHSNSSANSIWTIPSGWQQLPPPEFLVAKFSIAGADGASAQVNVSSLAGEGGGFLANVNRWRGQLGLPPFAEADLLPYENGIDVIGSPYGIVDFVGTDSKTGKPSRLVGAIVPQNGHTWFYKLMGDGQIVAQQKDAFIKFIQSANYANARNAP